jgi:hypothetical protein
MTVHEVEIYGRLWYFCIARNLQRTRLCATPEEARQALAQIEDDLDTEERVKIEAAYHQTRKRFLAGNWYMLNHVKNYYIVLCGESYFHVFRSDGYPTPEICYNIVDAIDEAAADGLSFSAEAPSGPAM